LGDNGVDALMVAERDSHVQSKTGRWLTLLWTERKALRGGRLAAAFAEMPAL